MDSKKIFIGNLPYSTTKDTLVELFLQYGEIVDAYKPEGKGFAFITFATEEQAQNAITAMNGQDIEGRAIVVNISRPKEDRPRTGGFGGGRDSRGGYGGGRDGRRPSGGGFGGGRNRY